VNVLAFWVFLTGKLWLNLEGVGTEVISLGLEKVGREVLGTVTIEPVKSGAESWGWDTEEGGLGDNVSPSWLCLVDSLVEEIIEEQVLKIWVLAVSGGDVLQENGSDDATTAPHESNGWLVELPFVFLGGLEQVSI
jgi:hypothetical protein